MAKNPYKSAKISVKALDITILLGVLTLAVIIALSF